MPFLPITLDEVKRLGWSHVDVVIVSGDAYVDHPSFGAAVLGRSLEAAGFNVAIIPQPNWRDDLRDFRKFGRPRLCFLVSSGCMDSMVNHYTAARRLRHDDAYTPGGESGFRPDRAAYVYTRILKQQYPDVPVLLGGIEASMRRLAHYDYWDNKLFPSILADVPADVLTYGMGEKLVVQMVRMLDEGQPVEALQQLPQQVYITSEKPQGEDIIWLHSFEDCLKSKRKHAENFHYIEKESNKIVSSTLVQQHGNRWVVVNPPDMPFTEDEIDASFDLPYMRQPHPKYKKRGTIPAFEMIKHSINSHRGCFGGCAFCTISAHQGKQIVSRSERSILAELEQVTSMPDFHGTISDLGGPSANMYRMQGKNKEMCRRCARYSCIQPSHCPNLDSDHTHILNLYKRVSSHPKVKHLFIGSGIRYDLFTQENGGHDYFRQVVLHHVSGRLKVAPEHTSSEVLKIMRKPSFDMFIHTKRRFEEICHEAGLRYQLIPYFISSHPGCRLSDMADLAVQMKKLGYRLEQVQDFTPTPMTLATEMYYTGINPETMQPIYVATHPNEKKEQNLMFFYYKRELHPAIKQALIKSNNQAYLPKLGIK